MAHQQTAVTAAMEYNLPLPAHHNILQPAEEVMPAEEEPPGLEVQGVEDRHQQSGMQVQVQPPGLEVVHHTSRIILGRVQMV